MLSTLLPGFGAAQPAHGGAHALPRGSRGGAGGTGRDARTAVPAAYGGRETEGGTFFQTLVGGAGGATGSKATGSGQGWADLSAEEEEEDDSTYLIKTRVQDNVYGACFVTALRGLRDRKMGTVVMSYVWVILSAFLTYVVATGLLDSSDSPMMKDFAGARRTGDHTMKYISDRLKQAISGEKPLSEHNYGDKDLVLLCESQPSLHFHVIIQFIWAVRCMGQFTEARQLFSMFISCPVKEIRGMTIVEDNSTMTIAALLPFDALAFSVLLVVPKVIAAFLIWVAGCRNLVMATDFMDLLFRAVSQHYITTIETQVFQSFIAHSKKEWVVRARVVQERTQIFRIFLSWPGEVLKLMLATLGLAVTIYHYRTFAHIQDLCFKCIHTCPNVCAPEIVGLLCPGSGAADIRDSHLVNVFGR